MGVYIPKMEMPNDCYECPLMMSVFVFKGDSDICSITDGGCTYGERPPHCPLVEVKPHGRLIEDTALDNMSTWNTDREYDRGWDSAVQAAKNRIKTAPTIIEAEGENG